VRISYRRLPLLDLSFACIERGISNYAAKENTILIVIIRLFNEQLLSLIGAEFPIKLNFALRTFSSSCDFAIEGKKQKTVHMFDSLSRRTVSKLQNTCSYKYNFNYLGTFVLVVTP
jgi:hypothetical protein